MRLPSVVIVSPALAEANNGNWRTASRWRRLLAASHAVRITAQWPDAHAHLDQTMLALHARRSAPAIRAWADAHGPHGLAVVLTGTDLYQDIHSDAQALESLHLAQRLVVLQALGPEALPPALRAKARVIYQSTTPRQAQPRSGRFLRAVMVGHLRAVKSPQTLFEAARLLRARPDIQLRHIGADSEPGLALAARATEQACPAYRWLGPLPHEATRRAIAWAHLLVHPSVLEGGAHVIMEAVRSGTPVLASRVPGNVGMLGDDYAGYFPPGDAPALAALLLRCRDEQAAAPDGPGRLLALLHAQCALRARLFTPEAERAGLLALLAELLG